MDFLNMFYKITLKNWNSNLLTILLRVIGITASMTFAILILVYLLNEYNYDEKIDKKEDLYRVLQETNVDTRLSALTSFPLKPLIINGFPEVADAFRYSFLSNINIQYRDKVLPDSKFCFADTEIFNEFNIEIVNGRIDNILLPYRIAISKSVADKYFNGSDPVGEILTVSKGGKSVHVIVTAVFENIPLNSTFFADIIGNFEIEFELTGCDNSKYTFEKSIDKKYYSTYLRLVSDCSSKEVETKINQIIQNTKINTNEIIKLQRVEDIYFYSSEIDNNFLPMGNMLNIKIFTVVCVFLILIATSNFIVISSTIHYYRKQEYIIRLINGANRLDVLLLVGAEIFLILIISMALSWGFISNILPYTHELFRKEILITEVIQVKLLGIFLVTGISIGIVTIIIVSLYLFGKESFISSETKQKSLLPFFKFNKLLVFAQIGVFTSLIIISFIVIQQWNLLKSSETLGFDMNNVLIVELPTELVDNPSLLKNELEENSKIVCCGEANNLPLFGPFCFSMVYKKEDYSTKYNISMLSVGENFFKTIDISILEGRDFDFHGDYDKENSLILNESAVKFFELEGSPVGQKVMWRDVVAVVEDFHLESMYHEIAPVIIYPCRHQKYFLLAKYIGDRASVKEYIEQKQIEIAPLSEINIYDYSSVIEGTYEHEMVLKSIFLTFTLLTVLLGVVGLLGLVLFTVQKRKKEIMIRTVHGASAIRIIFLISKDFIISLIISNIITYPLIWYIANEWLDKFVYHIELRFVYFLCVTILTVFIIFSSVSIIVLKHLRKNPIYYLNH